MKKVGYVALIDGNPVRKSIPERKKELGIVCRDEPTQDILDALGLDILYEEDQPSDQPGKIIERDKSPVKKGDVWVLSWTVRDASDDEVSEQRKKMNRLVSIKYSEVMKKISSLYPVEEREGWSEQVAAAEVVLAGGTSPLIDALRQWTGETAEDMANKIMAKRDHYMTFYGAATGNRRFLDMQIKSASDKSQLDMIDITSGWP